MSEEILKALMQLFAILTKQEGGPSPTQSKFVEGFLKQQLSPDKVPGYFEDFLAKSKPKAPKAERAVKEEKSEVEETPEEREKRLKREERRRAREERKKQKEAEAAAGPPENETEEEKEKRLRKEARRKEREALKAAEAAKEAAKEAEGGGEEKAAQLTSMKDSVKTLAVCKKINKTLAQKQKVIAFVRLLELIWVDRSLNPNAKELMDTVANVFNISEEEYKDISGLTITEKSVDIKTPNILVVSADEGYGTEEQITKHILVPNFGGEIRFLKVPSVELYFVKVVGNSNLYMNGLPLIQEQVYLFPPGSTVKPPSGKPIYYSDIVGRFLSDSIDTQLSFHAENIEFKFPNGNIGLRGVEIQEDTGKLVGIMGASGAGKSTLLNVLNGNEAPTSGRVLINGVDIHKEKDKVEGVIGYVPQDDLLLDDLTVYENLYYNAKLCLSDLSDEEIDERIIALLKSLDLLMTKDLKVGNPLEKTISGGQRKRLNIGLELLREPAVIFMDEPTSGLSSRDSENILDLLKELVLKGKIIFVVIHQPSSDIYKMFDKMLILDVGGYPVYYGNPVEAVLYFKRKANQVNSESGECTTCGNVNPELIFNIIGAKLVDDYGKALDDRKVTPVKWNEYYKAEMDFEKVEVVDDAPPSSLNIPHKVGQLFTFIKRDVLSKVKNKQYMYLNLLEAPALAFVLSFIVRYIGQNGSETYTFFHNENIPAYVFMSIVVSLFMGLMVSAEEIIKDAKIQKREKFLNLSRSSYLGSKLAILFTMSAIQSLLFVLVGNFIIEFKGIEMWFSFWLVMFSVSSFANLLGLNISASFNSVVTIYILIPLILIPQMILSGAMFSFDKINSAIGGGSNRVPVLAEVMASRWAYEALAVKQFKDNELTQNFYELDFEGKHYDYYSGRLIKRMEADVNWLKDAVKKNKKAKRRIKKNIKARAKGKEINPDTLMIPIETRWNILKNSIELVRSDLGIDSLEGMYEWELDKISRKKVKKVGKYLGKAKLMYGDVISANTKAKDDIVDSLKDNLLEIHLSNKYGAEFFEGFDHIEDLDTFVNTEYHAKVRDSLYNVYTNSHTNGFLQQVLMNEMAKEAVFPRDSAIYEQAIWPVYRMPETDFIAHFYAPKKKLFGSSFNTFGFNLAVIWIMTFLLYLTLYFEVFKKALNLLSFKKK